MKTSWNSMRLLYRHAQMCTLINLFVSMPAFKERYDFSFVDYLAVKLVTWKLCLI